MQVSQTSSAADLSDAQYQKLKTQVQDELKRTEDTGTKMRNEVCNVSYWN